jgi:glycosyltransferase involved in cell wall biosynthesis
MEAALAAQRGRSFQRASELYREALVLAPDEPDALHMLGVVCYERGEDDEAYACILRALDLTDWRIWSYRHNLGLVVARLANAQDRPHADETQLRYRHWRTARGMAHSATPPKVAVVIPCYNHATFVTRALSSVFAQTYRHIELVVIDDGSTDGSVDAVRRTLEQSPFPSRFVCRPNRGAAASLNEGVALSDAPYVNLLNSDDVFAPDRLQTMVDAIAGQGFAWGFSGVDIIDAEGRPADPLREARALRILMQQGTIPLKPSVGFALLDANVAISSGNLFFSRELFDNLGGFRDYRYNHDWDFCLRALRLHEPRYARERTYGYRLHGANTISESAARARSEADEVVRDYLQWATTAAPSDSAWAPCVARWGEMFVIYLLSAGMAELLTAQQLRAIVADLVGGVIENRPLSLDAPRDAPVASSGV